MILVLLILLKTIRVYSYILLAYALLSWFPGAYDSWIGRLVVQIVDPIIRPLRRFNLQFLGLDFTVIVAFFLLNMLSRFLILLLHKMTLDDIYQHFRPEEYAFIHKIDHLAQYVENTYSFITTEFLNPREFKILESVLERRGSHYYTSGQYFQTEYVKVIIAPEYYQLDMADFNLSLIEIKYNAKFNHLTHAKIMGTLLNYLGVKRSILGDILVEEGCAQVLVDSQMTNHLVHSVTKIGTASVQLAEVPLSKLLTPKQDIQKLTVIASSLRLDKILATILKISRTQSTKLIEADKVKVNYATVNRVSEQLVEGDLISVRGYGRFTLNHNLGLTKNQKYKLEVDKMIHN